MGIESVKPREEHASIEFGLVIANTVAGVKLVLDIVGIGS